MLASGTGAWGGAPPWQSPWMRRIFQNYVVFCFLVKSKQSPADAVLQISVACRTNVCLGFDTNGEDLPLRSILLFL